MDTRSEYMTIDRDDPLEIERRNNLKKVADNIRQILSKVQNNHSRSSKRWIWELMQNAKDVPNEKFGQVSIQVVLNDDQLEFRHNGDPFTLENIYALVQQVSSKDSVNADEKVTGKFGTGFIATHLLSDVIDINGYVKHKDKYRKFSLSLDRSAKSSEEMLPKIEEALNYVRQIEDEDLFPIVPDYDIQRDESDLDTSFTYYLTSDEKKRAAVKGVKDLIHTLPITLTNNPKIKRVEILDKVQNTKEVYECTCIQDDNKYKTYQVKISRSGEESVAQYFISRLHEKISLTAEIKDPDSLEIIPATANKRAPRLYRDFPLIGSDTFYFPFYINGYLFNPTENRDGILLHSREDPEARKNRDYISTAYYISTQFIEHLVLNDAGNLFVLAQSRIPEENWDKEFSKNWIQELQKKQRMFLLSQFLVENELGDHLKLRDSFLPNFGSSEDAKISFYKIVKKFKGVRRVPKESQILSWIKYTGPKDELESWGHAIHYELNDLVEEIVQVGNIEALANSLPNQASPIQWLNELYEYIIHEKRTDVFQDKAIIPNHRGEFKELGELYLEDAKDPIPDEFLEVHAKLTDDWREVLIHREVRLPDQNIDQRGLSDLSIEVNKCLSNDEGFAGRDNATNLLVNILRNYEPNSPKNDIRAHLFQYGKDVLNFEEEIKEVINTSGFRFEVSLKLFISLINTHLSQLGSVKELAKSLTLDENATLEWIEGYLQLIEHNATYKQEIEGVAIIPNRKKEFCKKEDLHNYGTEETPLDDQLLQVLKSLDPAKDWNENIIHPQIHIEIDKAIKFEELGAAIKEKVSEIMRTDAFEPGEGHLHAHRAEILDLIEWVGHHPNLAERYLEEIVHKSSKLFLELTLSNNTVSMDVIKMLDDPESQALMSKISTSKVSKKDISELLDLVNQIGSTEELARQAHRLKEEKENMEFLLNIGKQVEEVVKAAISDDLIGIDINHDGRGAFDFEFHNSNTGKKYFLELKSYVNAKEGYFRFAPSQAEKAILDEANFAIAFMQRPDNHLPSDEYIQSNLTFSKYNKQYMERGFRDYISFKAIKNSKDEVSKLRTILLEPERIEVSKLVLLENSKSFNELIKDIKGYLT